MARRRGVEPIAVCIGLLLGLACATSADKCTTGCHGMQPGKSYQEGHTYVYDLEGVSVTTVSEAKGDATLKLKATVELSVKPDCVHQIRLKGVQVNGAPIGSSDVEGHAIQFNYHDGHIDTELCSEPGDTQESLNIKRAVVSLFQSAVIQESGSATYHETDVFGGCPTEFSFHKEGDSLVVQKHRNLAECAYRENINQGLVSATIDPSAGIKSSPLLDAHQKVEQRFKRGILNKAASTETYRFRPFNVAEAGARTIVETTLTLKGEKGDSPTGPVSKPKSLIFDPPHPVAKSSVDSIIAALKAAKAEVNDGVKHEAAARFADLVKTLRAGSKNDMLQVYQRIRAGAGFDKVADQKLFLDALLRAGSSEAVEVAVELVKNREIQGLQALFLYASLPLVAHVNLPAVTAVASLLEQPDLPRIGYLGVGQVIGKYCQQHPCENVREVKEAVNKIREKLGNGRTKNREQENTIVSTLKALGNAKFLDDPTMQKIANIAADKNVRNRVRVAAIEALPARCSMKWKNVLLKVLADLEEDSEVRIKSYLSLVNCACPHVANQLKEILDKETVNQVGSFIQSHLRNLRASADPNKQAAKQQLGQIKPRTKFPEDFRKFSFNNEFSYNIDAYGLGSSFENNVIFSQNSFVPRSVDLNLTAGIFGRNFNFLEVNTRAENLDRVLEHFFGPKGKIREYTMDTAASEGKEAAQMISNYIIDRYEKIVRTKRNIKQKELDRFAKDVALRGTEVDEDLDLDLSMKLFGVELAYLSYQGESGSLNYKNIIDKIFENMEKGANTLKNFNYNLQNHLHFLDAEIVYPTGLGAALSLGVTGTGVVHLKTSGKFDIFAILKDPSNASFRVALDPSVSVRITGDLIVKSFGCESGMKLVGTLHTSTGTDLNVRMLNGHGIDVNVGVPKKKQELVKISSEVFLTSGPKGEKLVSPKFGKGKVFDDCFEQFTALLGMNICGHVSFPYDSVESVQKRPPFPLSGPATFAISLENNDVSSYHFKVFHNTEQPSLRSFEILLDTPNSRTNRRISLLAEAGTEPNKHIKLSFDSPIKKASAEAVLKNNHEERTITVSVSHDSDTYFARVGLLAGGGKYRPVLEYKLPEHIERLAGTKGGSGKQQYDVQGAVDVSDYQDGNKFKFENVALIVSGRKLVGLDGSLTATPNQVNVDTKIGYLEESLAVKLDARRIAEKNYQLFLSVVPSRDPNIGFSLNWDYKRAEFEMEQKLVFTHGPDPESKLNRLTFEQKYHLNTRPKDFEVSTSNELTYPAMNAVAKLEGKLTRNSVEGDVEVKYDKFKLGSELSVKVNTVKNGDYDVEFEAEMLENSVKLKAKRTVIDPHKSKFKNSLVLVPGGKYEADGVVTYDVSKNNVNVQVDGEATLNGKKLKVDTGLEANTQVVNSRAFVTIENVKYVEFVLAVRRAPNPNGQLNLNLKNLVTANGQFGYQNGKGDAHLVIDVPKLNRKIKADGNVQASGSHYVANGELLYDADKDPSKRLKFSTDSEITKTSVNTHNIVEVLAHKFELNGKGKMVGTLDEGQLELEGDLTLPNGQFVSYNGKRSQHKKNDKLDIQVQAELAAHEKKAGPAYKVKYNAEAHEVDPKGYTFKANAKLQYVSITGKDLVIAWNAKNLKHDGEKRSTQAQVDLSGAYLPRKVHFDLGNEDDTKHGTFNGKLFVGDDLGVQTRGEYSCDKVQNSGGLDAVLEVKLPFEKLKDLKLQTSHSVQRPTEESDKFELSLADSITYNGDKTVKLALHQILVGLNKPDGPASGEGKLTLNILQAPAVTVGGGFKCEEAGEKRRASHNLNIGYGDKEATVAATTEYLPDLSYVNVDAKSTLPFEQLRNLELQLNHKRENEGKNRKTDIAVTADKSKYTLTADMQEDGFGRMVHAIYTCPAGKSEVLSKFQVLGDREYKGEWKVTTPNGYVMADALVNLESVDDFVIKVNFDSDKIKPPKIHAEIANKPTAKAGRRIVITVTSDGQNIVTGSTNYKRRDEDGKIVVEGNGNLKIGESTRSSSFKYTRQQLTREADGEVGVAMVLNANFGPSAIVGELKLSNKELHVFNSYCEQSKDCAYFKLQSTLDTDQKAYLKHLIIVEVDLKKFNVPAEFGLKTSTEYKNFNLDHDASLYLHSSKDKSVYSYQLYVHPKESAAILTLPSRELALVLTLDLPKTKQTGAYKLDASAYLDRKNKPSDKTSLTATGDFNIDKNSLSLSGETRFVYPNQPKEMLVKGRLHCGGQHLLDGNLDIDLFAKKSQKIAILAKIERQEMPGGYNTSSVLEVNSRGQPLKIELKSHAALSSSELGFGSFLSYNDVHQKQKSIGVLFSADPSHVLLLAAGPDQELIRYEGKMELGKNQQKVDGELSLFGKVAYVAHLEADNMNSFKYTEYSKSKPDEKLTVNGQVVLGQLAEIHADNFVNGKKMNLFHALVHLDEEKFLKPDFGYNKDHIMNYINNVHKESLNVLEGLKGTTIELAKEAQTELKDLFDHLKRSQPNIKPLIDYYQTELNKLKSELHADETVKEIQAMLQKHFGAIAVSITETIKHVLERLDQLQKQFNEILQRLGEALKAAYPQLIESYNRVFQAMLNIFDAATKLALTYLNALLNLVNQHQKELKDLMVLVSEVAQDVAKVVFKALGQVKQNLEEFGYLLANQLKAVPIFEILNQKYQELLQFQLPEAIIGTLEEVCNIIRTSMPTAELREFLDLTCRYIMKHVKREKIDEGAELKKLYGHAVSAFRSIVALLQTQISVDGFYGFVQTKIPFDLGLLTKLPGITTLRVSVLNLIRNNELPSLADIYYTYRPTHFLSDLVPPFSKTGTATDGGHFFTFDGRHFTMPGTCNYILAQDIEDGNFSVVANFNNGVFTAITVTEPKESITITQNGAILVNNKPADYPANTKNLHAFLTVPFINIKSDYGVHVACTAELPDKQKICRIHVSGFYHGKLRGLLGDANNEPYDDFTVPSGKIVESASDFGNAYRLKQDCKPATAVHHEMKRAPICTEYFASSGSSLQSCFNYVNPTSYREACDHAIAAGTKEGGCLIAAAYHAACYEKRVYGSSLPTACSSCKVDKKEIAIGDEFSVKVPTKEADIIFVVEQQSQNEKVFKDMVVPLMSELRGELKLQGITDVHIGLIGFGEKMKWPQHYTVNGNTNIEGDVKNMKFEEQGEPIVSLQEAAHGDTEKKLTYLGQRLDVELGTFKLTDAYEEAIRYPFRPGAAKVVVGVIVTPCEKSPFPVSLQQLRLLLGQKIYRDLGLTYYHVALLDELLVHGKPQKHIVGYDQDVAYTFADSKKKPFAGSTETRNNLEVPRSDVCADFAVSSGGAAFSSENFLEGKPHQKKQFVQVAAKRIVEGLANVELQEDCVCQQQYGMIGRTTCKVTNRREKEPIQKYTKGGVKG